MEPVNLIVVCTIAFAVVFAVLSVLAIAMSIITRLFPERAATIDAPVVVAIAGTVGTLIPGARVTRIEEEPCSPRR